MPLFQRKRLNRAVLTNRSDTAPSLAAFLVDRFEIKASAIPR